MKHFTLGLGGLISLLACPVVLAGTSDIAPVQVEQEAPTSNWDFELGFYGFLAGVDGTISAGVESGSFSYDLGDVLDHLDATFMIAGSARKDRIRISADLLYMELSGSGAPVGTVFESAKLDMETLLSTVSATYTVWECPNAFLEIGAGTRYMGMDTSLGFFDTNGPNPDVFESADVDIWDALGVVRFGYQFSPKWMFRFYGDVGGGDSKLTWQVFGTLAYKVSEHAYATLGYRYLDYEMQTGPVDANISISGPQLGLVFSF
jgi:opacity protein-like surface antigen